MMRVTAWDKAVLEASVRVRCCWFMSESAGSLQQMVVRPSEAREPNAEKEKDAEAASSTQQSTQQTTRTRPQPLADEAKNKDWRLYPRPTDS